VIEPRRVRRLQIKNIDTVETVIPTSKNVVVRQLLEQSGAPTALWIDDDEAFRATEKMSFPPTEDEHIAIAMGNGQNAAPGGSASDHSYRVIQSS